MNLLGRKKSAKCESCNGNTSRYNLIVKLLE
jgi:hypothetical protein